MLSKSPTVSRADFEARTGWTIRPEGACKGDVCVPLAGSPGVSIDLATIADQLGMALAHDAAEGVWALGPESVGGRTLTSAVAPNLALPDLDGEMFELASLRGNKVLLLAWSPY